MKIIVERHIKKKILDKVSFRFITLTAVNKGEYRYGFRWILLGSA